MKQKKVAIVSCYYVKNYGSMLQAYAVQKMLDNFNLDSENLDYVKSRDLKQMISYAKRLIKDSNIRKTQIKNLNKKIYSRINKIFGKNFNIRNKKFEEFKDKYFRVSKPYYGYEALKESSNDYDAFILGSDQLWHPMNFENHYFTMEFINKGKTKITYAPSFGVSSIPQAQIDGTRDYLNRIEKISVREESGKKIIKELTGRDVPVVLDPTFMIKTDEWDEILPEKQVYNKGKYIFCYFLGDNKEHREEVERIKKLTGYDIVTLPYIDEIAKSDKNFGDEQLFNVGPAEFIDLIKNAEVIFTDSFHCTAFSIMYKKKFFTFNRFNNNNKASTNTRLKSILLLLGLEDRLITDYRKCEEMYSNKINYNETNERLEKMKKSSLEYITNALEQV